VRLHLHTSQRRVKDCCDLEDIAYHTLISRSIARWLSLCPGLSRMLQMQATQLRIHASCPSTSQFLLWNVFWKFSSELCLRHLRSFVVAFNEQVQNIGKSKASIVEVASCFATVKARIQERQSDVHVKPRYISTKKNSAKARIMTVIHSCQMSLCCICLVLHIWMNGPLYLLNLNALSRFLRLQTTNWETDESCE